MLDTPSGLEEAAPARLWLFDSKKKARTGRAEDLTWRVERTLQLF